MRTMAKQDKKQVKEITSMEENFTQWYTDICLKAEMVDYASVKGFMIMRPYGYAIWENMVRHHGRDVQEDRPRERGHAPAHPRKPAEKGRRTGQRLRSRKWLGSPTAVPIQLEERLAVRPTSETMFCDHWAHVLHSWRRAAHAVQPVVQRCPLGKDHPPLPAQP